MASGPSASAPAALSRAGEEQVLSFRVGGTEFACPVRTLREVVELCEVSRVEGPAGAVDGVINYRGVVVPVVDARRALGFAARPASTDAHIVVSEVAERLLGLVVDQVLDVLSLPADAIEPPGPLVPLRSKLSGIAKHGERLLFVLDLGALVTEPPHPREARPTPLEPPNDALLSVLRSRASELANPVAASDGLGARAVAMVCFAQGKAAYAVRAEHTREIVPPSRITPVPSAPSFVLGAVNIRGAIVAVVSVGALLGIQPRPTAYGDARIIVVEVAGAVVGLHVERVIGIYEVAAEHIAPPFTQLEAEPGSCIEGEFDRDGMVVCVLDAAAVVRLLEEAPPRAGAPGRTPAGAEAATS